MKLILFLFFNLNNAQFSFQPHFWENLNYQPAILNIQGALFNGRKIQMGDFTMEVFRMV